MALLKTRCTECKAPLKSSAGFTVGATVCCPKCETYFTVEDPDEPAGAAEESQNAPKSKGKGAPATRKPLRATADEDDADEKPKKKKKAQAYDDDEDDAPKKSYKNSPVRFAVLGVLVVTMLVLGYFLYDKRKKEREVADGGEPTSTVTNSEGDIAPAVLPKAPGFLPMGGGGAKGKQPSLPGKQPGGKQPGGKQPDGKQPGAAPKDAPANPFGVGLSPAAAAALEQKLKTALVGKWSADLGNGVTQELTYGNDGTFAATLTGPNPATVSGKYMVRHLVGTKGLYIQLDAGVGAQFVTAIFEDDELQQRTLLPGVTGTFRKK